MPFRPSSLWYVAMTGQTGSQGAAPHCWQSIGALRMSTVVLGLGVRKDRLAIHAALEVAVADPALDAQPRHVAAAPHRLLADHRDVVLDVAGDHARRAAGALVDVDRHAPAVERRGGGVHARVVRLDGSRVLRALAAGLAVRGMAGRGVAGAGHRVGCAMGGFDRRAAAGQLLRASPRDRGGDRAGSASPGRAAASRACRSSRRWPSSAATRVRPIRR